MGKIERFIGDHYFHFNAAALKDAARAYVDFMKGGNKMLLAMAGAMSTAELGISLAEMIRQNKIQAVSTTGANLEEDVFNLVAHDHYRRVPGYRNLSDKEEIDLLKHKLNRVTDTCIPEEEAMRHIENRMLKYWRQADRQGRRYFPYEYVYQLLKSGELKKHYQIDPRNSWVLAACEKDIPIYTPGWEDSTLGNVLVANVIKKELSGMHIVRSGLEQMEHLVSWYQKNSRRGEIGFFQIGGGIAGDFSICVVPLINQDLRKPAKLWGYFCQISDSTTSYGSYSGAVPNEKITWGKLGARTPRFIIESDATIVAPLIFAYVLGL